MATVSLYRGTTASNSELTRGGEEPIRTWT